MFEVWGRIAFRHRRLRLVTALVAIVAGVVRGTGVFRSLESSGGFTPPGSQSQTEASFAAWALGRDTADVVVLLRQVRHRRGKRRGQ